MYRGVRLDDVSVGNYETALQALEQRAKRSRKVKQVNVLTPGGDEAPLGHPRSDVTGVRMLANESIAFRLYRTDVVIWNKDNTVEVESYPTQTTTGFARCLLPSDLHLGQELMTYFPKSDPLPEWTGDGTQYISAWRHRWNTARICKADGTYAKGPEGWAPVDPEPMSYLELDRKRAREVSKEYNLADFRKWMSMTPYHIDIEHRKEDIDFCVQMLKERDFKSACMHLPTPTLPRGFGIRERVKPLPIRGVHWDSPITMSTLDRVRDYVYWQEDALTRTTVSSMSQGEWESRRKRIKALEKVGVYL